VRASATSRIATTHAAHTAQGAAANANKADDTSPFALLLASTAPKASAKDAAKDKAPDDQDEDTGTETPAVVDAKDAGAQTDATIKTGKSDDTKRTDAPDDDTKTAQESDAPIAAADTSGQTQAGLAALQALQMAQPVQPQTKTQPQTDAQDDSVGAAAGTDASAQPQAPAPADAKDKTPAPQTAADDADDSDAVTGAPGTNSAGKIAGIKPGDVKPQTDKAQADKAQTDKGQADKADAKADGNSAQPAPPPVQSADAAKPAAPQAHTSAIPQTTTAAANDTAPATTQHVQVAAQARPNIPALAVEVAAKSQAGAKQFDIRLDPPELGRVEVRLSIDATGKASAHLTADQPQTLDLLQKDSSSLTRALRDAGLDVSQNGLNFSLRQQSQDGGNAHPGPGGRGGARAFSVTQSLDATPSSAAYRGPADGRLDIKV